MKAPIEMLESGFEMGPSLITLTALSVCAALSACGGADQTRLTGGLTPAASSNAGAEPPSAAPGESSEPPNGAEPGEVPTDGAAMTTASPLYVFANEIYGADDSTTYVNILPSLDITELDHSSGMEFGGGRATIAARGGKLFVAPPTSAVIQRFDLGADGALLADGEVSFARFGFSALTIDEWTNTFITDEKAYLFNSTDGTTIVWNPVTMQILGEVDAAGFNLVREGWTLDGSPGEVRGDRLYRTITWANYETWEWSEERYLGVYDTTSDRLIELVSDVRCPALGNRVSRAEDGTLYFSNWIWNVGQTLVSGGAPSCVLRLLPGEDRFDPAWSLRYSDVAEGREGAMFAYVADGQALVSVFHAEQVTIDAATVPSELPATPNWRMWQVDLASGTGAPLEGLGWNTGAISTYSMDGRSFLLVPGEEWALTQVYEVEAGQAVHRFDAAGWSYQFFRVR